MMTYKKGLGVTPTLALSFQLSLLDLVFHVFDAC